MQSSDENESIIIVFDENQQETEASFEIHGEIIFADTVILEGSTQVMDSASRSYIC